MCSCGPPNQAVRHFYAVQAHMIPCERLRQLMCVTVGKIQGIKHCAKQGDGATHAIHAFNGNKGTALTSYHQESPDCDTYVKEPVLAIKPELKRRPRGSGRSARGRLRAFGRNTDMGCTRGCKSHPSRGSLVLSRARRGRTRGDVVRSRRRGGVTLRWAAAVWDRWG